MVNRQKQSRFFATDAGRMVWRIATGILLFALVWLAMRPVFWLTMGDGMLARNVAGFSGDTSSWTFWEIERLLEWGADPDYEYKRGTLVINPLFDAAASGQIAVAELLLEHGATRSRVNADGGTALDVACFYGEAEMANYLNAKGFELIGVYSRTWNDQPLPNTCAEKKLRTDRGVLTQEEK